MINYEMALYEIEMYKKAHESLSENLTLANKKAQQYKAERDKFEKMLNKEYECGYKLEGQLYDMTKQRDTLIDDLSWYKAKVSRLERENEKFKEIKQEKEQFEESFQYQIEKRLEYFNKYQEHKALNNEFSQHIGKKPSSSTYKYFRAKLDGIGIKESE
ncbi:hypothetical protein [Staphylococcus sp. ZWU0021]|uniref:hypothetical protein n=1 Tax=Staphylococcus sp. ZWU0021 TaxID=1339238 RepID=UPI00064895CC|nr:hypothetical protein [Staphylococcus sp. ZWU0021]